MRTLWHAISGETRLEALPALIAAGVLADAQPLAFVHPLLRSAIYFDVTEPVRAAEHGRAATLLHSSNAGAEAVSHHLLAAETVGEAWALAALTEAARTALARGSPESAALYLRRAAAGAARALRARRADAVARQRAGPPGRPGGAGRARGGARAGREPGRAHRDRRGRRRPVARVGPRERCTRLLLGALDDADGPDPERALALVAQVGLTRALDGSGGDEAIARLRATMPRLDGSTPARRYAAGALALLDAVCDGTAEEALGLTRAALANEASVDEDARAGRPQYVTRVALALAGEPAEALVGLERALGFSSARGSIMGQGIGLGWRALIQLVAGNVAETENDARASLSVLAGTGLSGPELGATRRSRGR